MAGGRACWFVIVVGCRLRIMGHCWSLKTVVLVVLAVVTAVVVGEWGGLGGVL